MKPRPDARPPAAKPAASGLRGVDMGIGLFVNVLVGGGLGYALDAWMAWGPWAMLVGGVLGFAAWLRQVWAAMRTI